MKWLAGCNTSMMTQAQLKATIHCNIQHLKWIQFLETLWITAYTPDISFWLASHLNVTHGFSLSVLHVMYKQTHLNSAFSPLIYNTYSCIIFSNQMFSLTAFFLSFQEWMLWSGFLRDTTLHVYCLHTVLYTETPPSGCHRLSIKHEGLGSREGVLSVPKGWDGTNTRY